MTRRLRLLRKPHEMRCKPSPQPRKKLKGRDEVGFGSALLARSRSRAFALIARGAELVLEERK